MPRQILVIDDDPAILLFLQTVLEDEGYAVTCAGDGREGLRLFARGGYDLVITDIVMPEREGLEVIMELRRQVGADFPVVAISGGGSIHADHYLSYANRLGARRTLAKPVDAQELTDCVRQIIGPPSP